MENTNESTKITELSTWDLETERVYNYKTGYDDSKPKPTVENMTEYLNKINELVNTVNELKECLIIARK